MADVDRLRELFAETELADRELVRQLGLTVLFGMKRVIEVEQFAPTIGYHTTFDMPDGRGWRIEITRDG